MSDVASVSPQVEAVERKPEPVSADRSRLREMHLSRKSPFLVDHGLAWVVWLCGFAAAWLWWSPYHPAAVPIWLVGGLVLFQKTLVLHDMSHRTYYAKAWVNELHGVILGVFLFVPLSAYRHVHAFHHGFLSRPNDPEMWPFTLRHVPRWRRVLAVVCEILLAPVYTPLLFLRGVLVSRPMSRRVARRICWEYGLLVLIWSTIFGLLLWTGSSFYVLSGFVPLAMIAGAIQTLNKYMQHLGLVGGSVEELTRTVADPRLLPFQASKSAQHVDYHGTHHRYAKIPHGKLPEATQLIYEGRAPGLYATHWSAIGSMLKSLGDPKAGPAWL